MKRSEDITLLMVEMLKSFVAIVQRRKTSMGLAKMLLSPKMIWNAATTDISVIVAKMNSDEYGAGSFPNLKAIAPCPEALSIGISFRPGPVDTASSIGPGFKTNGEEVRR
jgi:hypothetical protein